MECPCCSNRLRQVKSGSLIIDICLNCKGWPFSAIFTLTGAKLNGKIINVPIVRPEAEPTWPSRLRENLLKVR
jgi:hypothetical protein